MSSRLIQIAVNIGIWIKSELFLIIDGQNMLRNDDYLLDFYSNHVCSTFLGEIPAIYFVLKPDFDGFIQRIEQNMFAHFGARRSY